MGIVTDVILPLSLAFIMFSLGLGLSINDFTRVFFKPRDFLIGLFFQIIVLPIVAIIIVLFWPLTPELAIGCMILAAAPGGVTSNVLTSYAKEHAVNVIVIGQVTKDGKMAGSNKLKHMVDSHIHLSVETKDDDLRGCRVLETQKNRFGGAGHVILRLRKTGLSEVARISDSGV